MAKFADGFHSTAYFKSRSEQVLDPCDLEATLPKVGDTLYKPPHIAGVGGVLTELEPCECVVTYVNPKNLWYEVQFNDDGITFKECYKLPEVPEYPTSRELLFRRYNRSSG